MIKEWDVGRKKDCLPTSVERNFSLFFRFFSKAGSDSMHQMFSVGKRCMKKLSDIPFSGPVYLCFVYYRKKKSTGHAERNDTGKENCRPLLYPEQIKLDGCQRQPRKIVRHAICHDHVCSFIKCDKEASVGVCACVCVICDV